ncbi:RNA polymerase sigma-70 factor, ECF subfamily [Micromonospora phaseoli]|uniref:RNA polymerase sigma factor n=1 Tax=Micromonospora phaseoli TaxID=1144548 RepID=A0A1H7APX0_9ACTN|nr:RNA polymerase sigma factor [Micromonospora phaseoli]PZV96468.1 RNA polymerase ECF family sigma subunit [Micromonospora phaseoli]GIJ76156.1 DNA-directed RNA polymerase sigma-70 factor [Micromonospora phaseoli]SEJ63075.1 RNA polymerase sigma-70 factor, ECF subfamily [Micromonospora phaseoli]
MTHQVRPSDEALWSSITAGDEGAFGSLFDRYSRAVYNHAFRLTGSWSTAEDVTQTTFLVAWRRRGEARLVEGSALPWLLVVATNTVRSQQRSARRWLALLRRLPSERHTESDPADEVAARLDDERRMAEILAVVRRLPPAEREAVALCLWSGVSYPDAAVALGISEAAVRSRVSRARSRLARLMTGEIEEETR